MTFGAVNFDYRSGRFHRKVDGLVGIMLNLDDRCQYQVKDLAEDLAQEEGDALLLVGVEFPDGTYKNLPIYKIVASANDSEVYLCLGNEISNNLHQFQGTNKGEKL